MTTESRKAGAPVMPTLRYRDAPAAIDFLCRAFGFEKRFVVPGEGNVIEHAQLVFGHGMIMLGSARDDDYGRLVKPPRDLGGSSQGIYVVVADVDAHHARAVAAGAKTIEGPEDRDYGGRGYSCHDLEGHVWSFGSYDPWQE